MHAYPGLCCLDSWVGNHRRQISILYMHAVDKAVVTQDGRYQDSIFADCNPPTLLSRLWSFLEPFQGPSVRFSIHWILKISAFSVLSRKNSLPILDFGGKVLQEYMTPTCYLSSAWGPPCESPCSHSETSPLCGVRVSTAAMCSCAIPN